ncbi:hypothetical protein EAS64_10680 [Trebonia kvetii]|uniref:Uncharacterized protein n=1 Tax=Trebonia kvetii TaxID=2480626 RepID=A0A6P2C3K8_9ACTN|nr:hypothetical protein [Trebonia kvetii]TVZ05075.1 hypothetical protein EAS64_10680 [Trebonia kvetii]
MSSRLAFLAAGLVALLVLGALAGLVVDALEATAPVIASFQADCAPGQSNIILNSRAADPRACQWNDAVSQDFSRTLMLRISENKSGAFHATTTITTVAADPLVRMVQQGDGQDADEFYSAVVGWSAAGQATFDWSAPTVTVNSTSSKAVISTTGQPASGIPIPSSVQLVIGNYRMPATVEVSTQDRVVAGVPGTAGTGTVASENAHSLTVQNVRNEQLRVNLQPGAPQPYSRPPGPAGGAWIGRAASAAWALVSGFAGAIVPAGAWIALFLASRFGAFGAAGRRPAWRRMERVLGAVIVAHLVIAGCGQIATTGSTVASALNDYANRLDSTLVVKAGLWNIVEFPPVEGGTILLIVISLAIAGWEPRGDSDGRERPLPWLRPLIAVVALGAAVGGYAAIAGASMPPVPAEVLHAGKAVPAPSPWALAVEIPVAAVSMLAALFLASGWAAGAAVAGRAARARWGRGTIGVTALVMSVALPGAGLAGAIAITYGHYPIGGDTPALAGPAVFIAATAAAAVFALGAAAASLPWRRAGLRYRRYWIAPLAVALAVAATITTDSGYFPALLRWGVVIITGMFMGMAVARLAVMAVGPLRLPARGMPHLRAVALLAAVIAVPWGELGQPIAQLGWWDLQTYADRIDGVLGLVLVAAGVVALRRMGLLPCRDEETLASHRILGIAAWVVALSAGYAFGGEGNLATAAALVTAAIGAWLLMPRSQLSRAAVILSQPREDSVAAVRQSVAAGVARRALPSLAKTMRDEVAAGTTGFDAAQEKVTALEERAAAGAGESPVAADERAFGALISVRPWARARWGLRYAVLAGAPWVVLGLVGASVDLSAPEGYPELALISAVAPLVLRWAGYGLLFGYLFPLLRGRTGMGKSLSFFAAASAPSILSTLASPHSHSQQWHAAAILVIQLLIFAMTMGLLADLAVLRKNGFTPGRLVDLHSLWAVSAWASSVTLAVATGIATIILAGLQPFVIGIVTPSNPSTPNTPPAATSHP